MFRKYNLNKKKAMGLDVFKWLKIQTYKIYENPKNNGSECSSNGLSTTGKDIIMVGFKFKETSKKWGRYLFPKFYFFN